jgi:hypothetical protein
MVGEPTAKPVMTPVVEPTDTCTAVVLLHVPPGSLSVSVAVDPTHTEDTPVIAAGFGLTVNIVVVKQPLLTVYVRIDVPTDTPVTTF